MKKIVLILLSVPFFLTPIYSCSFPSHSLASMYKKINQPPYRIFLGAASVILLQFFNKKSIPGLRIPNSIKNIANNIELKKRENKAEKIIYLFKECDFIPSAIATFEKYGHGDAYRGKKANLFIEYNKLRNSKENLVNKIKLLYEKKKAIGYLNFKANAEGIAAFEEDFFMKADNAENCVIDEYLAGLLEKIKYLFILGELQLILYCLPFIYKQLNKTVED